MSDSGFSQFPTRPAPTPQATLLPAKAEVKVQIIDATGKLARVDTPQTVAGEVSKVNKDGTVEIKTDQGTLTVRPRERVYPAEGQKIEIDLSAGAPPKQATLRPAPAPSQPTPATSLPAPPSSSAPKVEINAPPPAEKPVTRPQIDQATQASLTRQQEAQAPAKPTAVPTTPQPLPEDAIVRLTPLPAGQAKQLVDHIIQTIQLRVTNAAFMSTQAAQAAMTQELTHMIPSLPRATLQNIAQQATAMPGALKTPLTALNNAINARDSGTALTPSLQPLRSPVENFMRQVLTQGSSFMTLPSSALSTQIMSLPANSPVVHLAQLQNAPEFSKLSLPGPALAEGADIPATTTPAFKANSLMDARVQNITPLNTPILSVKADIPSLPLQPGATPRALTAQVITMTPQQFPVISLMLPGASNPQLFTLNFPATNLMPGATLTVVPQPTVPAGIPATPPTAFELMSGFRWPAFDEFADLENMIFPHSPATQTLANILPQPGQPAKLPAAALLFIAAVRAGDINAWLGDKNVDALRRMGKAEFVARLAREFSGLNKLASEPVTPEWRGMSIPLYSDGQIDKIHLYYRHSNHGDDRDQEQAEKGKGTRFVMDLNLSHMGPVQLDGYTRGQQVDLIVRTQKPFGAGARYEMTQRYIKALEKAGFEGALLFQAQPEKFVNIAARPDLISASV